MTVRDSDVRFRRLGAASISKLDQACRRGSSSGFVIGNDLPTHGRCLLVIDNRRKFTNGVILAQAGRFGGWSLYVKDGKPTYTYNWLGLQR